MITRTHRRHSSHDRRARRRRGGGGGARRERQRVQLPRKRDRARRLEPAEALKQRNLAVARHRRARSSNRRRHDRSINRTPSRPSPGTPIPLLGWRARVSKRRDKRCGTERTRLGGDGEAGKKRSPECGDYIKLSVKLPKSTFSSSLYSFYFFHAVGSRA